MDPLFYSANRLKTLQGRVERCRCKYCGGQLELRQIVFNSYAEARVEIFCQGCDRIEYGVEREIYENARYFVDELRYQEQSSGDDEISRRQQIARVCDILSWGARHWGILTDEGFTLPIHQSSRPMDNCVVLEDDDLDEK